MYGRVRLSKRRKVGPGASAVAKSRLIVRHRPMTDQEIAAQVFCSSIGTQVKVWF